MVQPARKASYEHRLLFLSCSRHRHASAGDAAQGWGATSIWLASLGAILRPVLPEAVHELPKLVVIGQRDRDEVRVLAACS